MAESYNHFPQYKDKFRLAASQIIRKAAYDCEAGAKLRAPVDTGFLKNSIYVSTSEGSDYGKAQGRPLLEEVRATSDLEAVVGVGANYGAHVNYGTVHMVARPFFTQAFEATRPGFLAAMRRLEEYMR